MKMKDMKINFIVERALALFTARSINEVTVRDVADDAGVGEATVYRYFSKKQNLVKAVAIKLQDEIFKGYFDLSAKKTGYDKIVGFYNIYYKIFNEHSEFYRFVNEFDAFCINENVSELDEYSAGLEQFKEKFLEAYEQGIKDGSVRRLDDADTFYYATTHALLNLCKKLTIKRDLVKQDLGVDKAKEVKTMVEVILGYCKNPQA
ncbi:MAG: helix-turn-helix transcriptional regulator [Clostridia bacterium]|nr:helix-turn-helix transcriptional regulator [Clostridia bacterium]